MSEAKLVRYHTPEGVRAAVVVEGRSRLHAVVIDDGGVRELDVPNVEARYCSPLRGSVERAALRMLRAGKRLGITKSAKSILRAAITPKGGKAA